MPRRCALTLVLLRLQTERSHACECSTTFCVCKYLSPETALLAGNGKTHCYWFSNKMTLRACNPEGFVFAINSGVSQHEQDMSYKPPAEVLKLFGVWLVAQTIVPLL